jgi:hypothetical protein
MQALLPQKPLLPYDSQTMIQMYLIRNKELQPRVSLKARSDLRMQSQMHVSHYILLPHKPCQAVPEIDRPPVSSLPVFFLPVFFLSVFFLSVFFLSVFFLSVFFLSVFFLSVFFLSVFFRQRFSDSILINRAGRAR